MFVKLTNVGDEIIPLAGNATSGVNEQIRLVPEWKDAHQTHSHGHHIHSHHLLNVDAPWKSRLKWPFVLKTMLPSRALKPGQSEVLGSRELGLLWMDTAMPNPHMKSFQLALRLGSDRYALSESIALTFANVPELEKHPIVAKVERIGDFEVAIRQIEINNEDWLFFSHFRIARVPEGATPRFSTETNKQILVIEFDGVEEEPVRIDVRQAFPLSGSKRTVPHLHLWRSLTERSIFETIGTEGGFFKESGLTLKQAIKLKWDGTDPELKVKPTEKDE